MTNALDGKATLMSADDPELMAFTSTGRDVACFSPYYGMKDKCDWNGITQRLVIDLASYTGGNYYIYTGTEATPGRLAQALETCCLVVYEGHASAGYLSFTSSLATLESSDVANGGFYGGPLTDGGTPHGTYSSSGQGIANAIKTAPNNLFLASGCHTMENEKICNPLHEKGVAVVMGFTRSVTHKFADWARQEFLKGLKDSTILETVKMEQWETLDGLKTGELMDMILNSCPTVDDASNYMRHRLAHRSGLDFWGVNVVYWDVVFSLVPSEWLAKQYGCAFIFISSAEDPYPVGGSVQKKQDVTCQWRLPVRNPGELPPMDIAVPTGSTFRRYFGDVESSDLDEISGNVGPDGGWACGIEPREPGVTDIYQFAQKKRGTWFYGVAGSSDKPGYWENTSLLKNSDGEMVKRTVRILVYEKNPANYVRTTDEYTFAPGEEIEIPIYGSASYRGLYDIELITGTEPGGLSLFATTSEKWHEENEPWGRTLHWDDGEAMLRGVIDEPGQYSMTYRYTLFNGVVCEKTVNITIQIPEEKPTLKLEYKSDSFTFKHWDEVSEPLDIGEAYITDIQLTSGALPQGLTVNYTMSEPLQLKGTVWGAENPAGEYKAVFRIITSDYRCIAYTITVRVYGTVPYLDEYTIDLADGSAAVPQADFDQYIVRTLIYAMSNNELKFYLKQNKGKTEYLLLDLDKNDTWDISCVSDGGSPVFRLLDASSLTGDDYTFSLSDESIDEMNSDGVDMYARNLTFHLLDHYDLTIEGTEVTSRNREDILGDGVFSYDPEENVLHVKGDCVDRTATIIQSDGYGLTIMADVDCTLAMSPFAMGFVLDAKDTTVITGPGRLTMTGSYNPAVAQYFRGALKLQDADVTLSGESCAMQGGGSAHETQLIVENSTLRASSQNEWASVVNNFSGGTRLNGCSIVTPDGASFSDKITDADGKDVTEVLISPMHISVAGGTMTCSLVLPADNRPAALIAAWYDASGRMLGSTQKPVTCTGKLETTITVPSGQAEYRLFTVDAATRAPLISQLTCK